MLQLICEGSCNPSIAMVDNAVKQATAIPVGSIVCDDIEHATFIRGDRVLWAAQRSLKYTQHVETRTDHAVCTTCLTERKFGATL